MRAGRLFAAALLASASAPGFAFTGAALSGAGDALHITTTGPGGSTVVGSGPGGAVRLQGAVQVTSPNGSPVQAVVRSTVTRAGVAQMAGRVVAGLAGSPAVWIAVAAYSIYRDLRVTPDGAGGLQVHEGVNPSTAPGYRCGRAGEAAAFVEAQTAVGACAAYAAANFQDRTGLPQGFNAYGVEVLRDDDFEFSATRCGGDPCVTLRARYYAPGTPYDTGWSGFSVFALDVQPVASVTSCPPVVGQFAELYRQAPSADGKCFGGQAVPISLEDAAHRAAVADLAANWEAIMADVLGRAPAAPWPKAGEVTHELVQPYPGVSGVRETTQNPDGTSTVREQAINLTPRDVGGGVGGATGSATGAPVRWGTQTTQWTTDAQGNVIAGTTSTTTREGSDTPPSDPCDAHPERVGCMSAGEVEDAQLQERQHSVSVAPQAGWGAATASCPPPRVMALSFASVDLSFQPACDFLGALRPFLIAAASLAAAFVVLGMRGGSQE